MATEQPIPAHDVSAKPFERVVLLLIGAVLGLALLKFGNPIVFEGQFPPPRNLAEIIYLAWPAAWGFAIVAVLICLAIPLLRRPRGIPRWVLWAPLIWLGWQWIATFHSIQPELSRLTALHFTFGTLWFFLGLLATRGVSRSLLVWIGIGVALCLVISTGFRQQFGELEATRVFYEKLAKGEHPPDIQKQYDTPEFRRVLESPLFQHKVASERIYSTLFYPNTLAGVLILLSPGLLAAAWFGLKSASPLSRKLLPTLLLVGVSLCLVWSGSKSGWLIAMVMVGIALLRSSIPAKWRKPLIIGVAVVGLGLLVGRNLIYFQKGAKSVGARADYWAAAGRTFLDNPLTGSGPGTFAESYRTRKAADSEMARLAHNDFIQQASDSGAIGFVAFLVFVAGSIGCLWRHPAVRSSPIGFFIWLGLLGWGLQSLTEFGLYIPAIAWPAFFLLGLLWRHTTNAIDTQPANE